MRASSSILKSHGVWIGLSVALLSALVLSIVHTSDLRESTAKARQEIADLSSERDSLSATVADLEQETEQLARRIHLLESSAAGQRVVSRDPALRRFFRNAGLTEPVKQLAASLRERNDLIPHEGVLGGRMRFVGAPELWILGRRWVLAAFEDGHIRGKALLAYDVRKDGAISWRLIDSYLQ